LPHFGVIFFIFLIKFYPTFWNQFAGTGILFLSLGVMEIVVRKYVATSVTRGSWRSTCETPCGLKRLCTREHFRDAAGKGESVAVTLGRSIDKTASTSD
jgi:hypothetical protein